MTRKWCWISAFALMILSAGVAADPIGPDCGSCFGNIYTLSYKTVTPTDFTVTLDINTASTTLSATDFIAQVAFKPVSTSTDITSASLVSTTAPGVWTTTIGGLNNSGCTTGSEGFVCATDGNTTFTNGSTYDWVFNVQVASAADWLLGAMSASVKANFGPANGLITSEDITLQPDTPKAPEPATLVLLGVGLLAVAAVRKHGKR